jgi:hypothetical protein
VLCVRVTVLRSHLPSGGADGLPHRLGIRGMSM